MGRRCTTGNIAQTVKLYRLRLGLTQADVARRMGLDRSWVSRFEAGLIDPHLSQVRALARALDCHPWQLVADLYDYATWWDLYLALPPALKREVARYVRFLFDQGKE